MKRFNYIKSLQGRINISLLCIVGIAVVSFMVISIRQTSQTVQNLSEEYTTQLIDMVNDSIESYIGNMENMADIIINNSDVRNYLFAVTDVKTLGVYRTQASEHIKTLKDSRSDICNIGVIGEDGRHLINDRTIYKNPYAKLEQTEWYNKALEGEMVLTSSHVQNIVSDEYTWVVTLSHCIENLVDKGHDAVFFVDLNYRSISNLCEEINLGNKGYVYILDREGDLVYHPKQQLIYSGLWTEEIDAIKSATSNAFYSKDGTKLYTISKSDITGWTVVGVSYMEELLENNQEMREMYYMMAVALFAVAMLLSLLLLDMITLPLQKLRNAMKKVEEGDLELQIEEPGTGDEIDDLFHSFQVMITEIKQLIKKNTEEQRLKRKSELNALQAQINPHFLYNTLDSIIWMAEGGETKDVVRMTSALAKLLRKSISNRQEMVSLSEEIDYTNSYLLIQKMRYKDKLNYSIDVDSSILQMEVVKLIIQPLVENAIYHGIKYREDNQGYIKIKGYYQDDAVVIKVIDNGVGMTQEQLEHIFDERVIDTKKNGVGVLNVHQRIQLYYGEEYGLSYVSQPNEGTEVTIHLPDTTFFSEYERKGN